MRKRVLVLVAVLLLAVLGWLVFWPSHDPLEAARRSVRLGMDQAAVTAALEQRPDNLRTRRRASWTINDGEAILVEFDEDGKAVKVETRYGRTLWERFRAWWPW
jgi:hypothetical protein